MNQQRDRQIPRRPLLWLAAALLFTLPPIFATLAAWIPLLLLASIIAKFWMEQRGQRLRIAALKLLLIALALGTILVSYGAIKGLEPGVSLVIVLMALKILEAHTAREFRFMVMLGFVLCLCGFFLVQDFAPSLSLIVAFAFLVAALVEFHRRSSASSFWPPLQTASALLLQALPLIILLFLFFPRVTTGIRLLSPGNTVAAGFGDRLSPGSIASLATSNAVAFRVEFPDGETPAPDALYWRGLVLTRCDGLSWRGPSWPAINTRVTQTPVPASSIRQWITIEPHGGHWMFALDRPLNAPPGSAIAPGGYLWSWQTIAKARRYEVRSAFSNPNADLPPRERALMLELPPNISRAVRQLAQSWSANESDPRDVVQRALEFFRTQDFRYSLSPGEYRSDELDEFLLHRRVGFCEHYAAAFATLMRVAGIPARVVAGYLGGEWNSVGHFLVIRQSDTHAWCEVWLPDRGWTRVDPTSVVAPERVNEGLSAFLRDRTHTASPAFTRSFTRQPLFTKLRLAWQTLNYAWDTRVLSFDGDAQQTFITTFGLGTLPPLALLFWNAIAAAVIVAILSAALMLRAKRARDEVRALYERFCRKAARLGAQRAASEGPLDFSRRAAHLLPSESERIARISGDYVALRYAPQSDPAVLDRLTREVKAWCNR